ncbi:TPA: hypothetical protein N0F65_001613 [Lagenidium giganteum]|uniref:FAR1 domain-containing protein n=1 Tax=Lagenidium giganteum TaxID=4803 RepID=A0AAV2Z5L0_9STRA|nr:TPA: hypothetical protein N0F65_001613 [Lagenidium giganteum]
MSFPLPCLPEGNHDSPKDAQKALNKFARSHGYAVVVLRTHYGKHGSVRKVVYACDRHGEPRRPPSTTTSRPNSSTRKCGCGMRVTVIKCKMSLRWRVEHRNTALVHNHPPSGNVSAHPLHRRADMTEQARCAIATDAATGTRGMQTLVRLRADDPLSSITLRDVYNERARHVRQQLQDRTKAEYLLSRLEAPDFVVRHRIDSNTHRLTHLVFGNRRCLDIYRAKCDVLFVDCTFYRTLEDERVAILTPVFNECLRTVIISSSFLHASVFPLETVAAPQTATRTQ